MKKFLSSLTVSILLASNILNAGYVFAKENTSYKFTTYTVKKGDTLYNISKKYNVNISQIQSDNHLKTSSLKINQILSIRSKVIVSVASIPTINSASVINKSNMYAYAISGKDEPYSTIYLKYADSKGKAISLYTKANSKGEFSAKANLSSLQDGAVKLYAYKKTYKGVTSKTTVKSISKDTKAPILSFQASDILYGNQLSYKVNGFSESNAKIEMTIIDQSGKWTKKYVTASKGVYSASFDVHTLKDGIVTVRVISSDYYGNKTTGEKKVNKKIVIPTPTKPPVDPPSEPVPDYPIEFPDQDPVPTTPTPNPVPIPETTPAQDPAEVQVYNLDSTEMAKWNIYNDGTHPYETTKGINQALIWAKDNGKTDVKVPSGTYLISKGVTGDNVNNKVNLVSNVTLQLDQDATFKKETNGLEGYAVVYVGPGVQNATIEGGTLEGDRYTHDYSQKEGSWSAGTHEWGYGINVAGGRNITIQGMTIKNMTGDGIITTGSTVAGGSSFAAADLESGGLDENGQEIAQTGKVRTTKAVELTKTNFSKVKSDIQRIVNLWLASGLTSKDFTVCYYHTDDSFIRCDNARVNSKYSEAPKDADHFRIVLNATSPSTVAFQWMNIENAKGVMIKDNDIGFNRRQGITAGGENVQILTNKIHDTGGTAPSAGIDIEPGFFPARVFLIKGNEIYNNKIQTVLAYGNDATFVDNTFRVDNVPGSIGLYVWAAYDGINVTHNKFIGTGMSLNPVNSMADGNEFINGSATINGAGSVFKNGNLTDSGLSINGIGSIATDTVITNTGLDTKYKGSFSVGSDPNIKVSNLFLKGTPTNFATIGGYSDISTVFENITLQDATSGATGLPSGTYKNSTFTHTGVKTLSLSTQYKGNVTIDHSILNDVTLSLNTETAELAVKNSVFTYKGDLNYPAVYAPAGKNITVLNNTFTAKNLTLTYNPVVKLGQFAWATHNAKLFGGIVVGNTIHTNAIANEKGISTTDAGIGAPNFTITKSDRSHVVL